MPEGAWSPWSWLLRRAAGAGVCRGGGGRTRKWFFPRAHVPWLLSGRHPRACQHRALPATCREPAARWQGGARGLDFPCHSHPAQVGQEEQSVGLTWSCLCRQSWPGSSDLVYCAVSVQSWRPCRPPNGHVLLPLPPVEVASLVPQLTSREKPFLPTMLSAIT